jgi:broad specificity phosphatase PhoE
MEQYKPELIGAQTEKTPKETIFSVYLMRHGKPVVASENYGTDEMPFSEFEEAIDVQRSMELPLSENGKEEIIKSLKGEVGLDKIKIIIASPYLRTRQTAEIVAEYILSQTGNSVEVLVSDLLKEVEFDLNALTEDEYIKLIKEKGFMGVLDKYVENWLTGKQEKENINDTYKRAHRFLVYLRRVRKWTRHDKVFVSTHGWIGRIIKHLAEGGEKGSYAEETRMLKTGEIFKFGEDDLIELGY